MTHGKMKLRIIFPLSFLLLLPLATVHADDAIIIELDDDEYDEYDDEEVIPDETVEVDQPYDLGAIEVIGQAPEQLESVPGSASVITEEQLKSQRPISGNEALRTLPGVHVRDEEGIGLRPNIGIRGLDPSRGRTLLVLEDGVPIALAPYGEPELYYAPAIDRIERIELVKGSGSVLFGPQTIGGVLNYITHDPPEEFEANAEFRLGELGYLHGQASVGDTVGDFGYRLGVVHQRFEGARNLNLDFTDVTARTRYYLSDTSDVGLKLHFYDESSDATYLGLTTPQLEANPRDNFAVNDHLPVRRFGLSATHNQLLGDNILLQTTAYGHHITRNWDRQDFDRADQGRDYERVISGQGTDITDSPEDWRDDGSQVFFRETMGARNREFYVGGIEPRATMDYTFGSVDNELIVGTRLHGELTNEQRVISQVDDPGDSFVRDDEQRRGVALAGYAQNRFLLMEDALRISPGIRVESFWSSREIFRTRVEGEPTDLDPPRENSDHVVGVIPGLGVSYSVSDEITLFSGVHRGFSPPRTKDAVTTDGDLLELDAEFSINYELGVRTHLEDWLAAEIAGFVLDFSNQIIPPAEAAGATGADPEVSPLVNAGETTQFGVETDVTFDVAALTDLDFRLPLTVAYTWVHAEFGDAWDEAIVGNRLPYAPEHRLSSSLAFSHLIGLSAQVNGLFISEQYTDLTNTEEPTNDGLAGRIDPYFLLDARVGYTLPNWDATLFVAGKNLTDETYISSRAPRGIQPGAPRQVFVGISGGI